MYCSSIAQVTEIALSDCGQDHEDNIIQIEEACPTSHEILLVQSKNSNEGDEENMDEYFREDCMSDKDE